MDISRRKFLVGLTVTFASACALMLSAATPDAARRGFVVVTDFVPADGTTDVADALQKVIDTHPNRTLYFPDGTYLLSKPIATPAEPTLSVDLQLSNYAILKAAPGWTNAEAMVRLGGIHPANNIRTRGSNYSFTGGVVDGSGVANGISIDSGRETAIRQVSIKHVRVGIHIKLRAADSLSSDADISDVNIVGNGATNSIGVLVEGYDNTFTGMRIADVFTGFLLKSGGNSLRNIHPLYTCNYRDYANSSGFNDRYGNNWYSFCYSDHFGVGFITAPGKTCIYDSCYCMWYTPNKGLRHTVFRAEGSFDSMVNNMTVGFNRAEAVNTVLEEGRPGGKGQFMNLRVKEDLVNEKECRYKAYLHGRVF